MTSRNSSLPTHARVYIDGGPVVRLTGRPTVLPNASGVRQTQDELRAELKMAIGGGGVVEGLTTDGEWVHIPARRIVDVVYPLLDPERIQGSESGMDEDERRAEAWLDQHGDVVKAVDLANRAFVEQYMADRSFGSETVVVLENDTVGVISGFDHNTRDFVIDQAEAGLPSQELRVGVGMLKLVLCWNLEDYAVTGDVSNGQITSAGFAFGPGRILELTGRSAGGTASEPLSGGIAPTARRVRDNPQA